jgi:hypothetical protein
VTRHDDPRSIARAIIGSSLYMVLGTADGSGEPWVSPVWYAHEGTSTFFWVLLSRGEALAQPRRPSRDRHRDLRLGRAVYAGQAVYMSAVADQPTDRAAEEAIEVVSRRSQTHGADAMTLADVRPPAELRLYRAVASAQWILEPGAPTDRRIQVPL